MKNKNILGDFVKAIEELSSMKSLRDNFVDFLDFQLHFFCENPTEEQKKWFTNELNSKIEQYKKAMLLFGEGSERYNDLLGEFFMQHITMGRNGQYFTPETVCKLMAKVTGDDDNGENVADTCCGSGRMLLAHADNSINPHNKKYYGNDIDLICVKMCLLNLLVNSLPGVITWGDGLKPLWMESRDTFVISLKKIFWDDKIVNIPQYKYYSSEETKSLYLFPESIPKPKEKPTFEQLEFTEMINPIAKGEQLSLF